MDDRHFSYVTKLEKNNPVATVYFWKAILTGSLFGSKELQGGCSGNSGLILGSCLMRDPHSQNSPLPYTFAILTVFGGLNCELAIRGWKGGNVSRWLDLSFTIVACAVAQVIPRFQLIFLSKTWFFKFLFEFSAAEITFKAISPTFWIQILSNKLN
jgi:hypothetical protein